MNAENADLWYQNARIRLVENRIRTILAFRRSTDPHPDDPFRGLYIGAEAIDGLLEGRPDPVGADQDDRAAVEREADTREAAGSRFRLRRLARSAGLDSSDIDLLLICALPEIDSRWERIYGYLNDDVSRRRASPALALALAGRSPWDSNARSRMAAGAPLIDLGLLRVEDSDRPFLTRTLRVPDRVVQHLLGGDRPPATLAEVLLRPAGRCGEIAERLRGMLEGDGGATYLREDQPGGGVAAAVAAAEMLGRPALVLAGRRVEPDDARRLLHLLRREAVLTDAVPVIEGFERLAAVVAHDPLVDGRHPAILVGRGPWPPEAAERLPLVVESGRLSSSERSALWRDELGATEVDLDSHTLAPDDVRRVADIARRAAVVGGTAVTTGHVLAGARMLNSAGLQRLARLTTPDVTWRDLVLPAPTVRALHDLCDRARYRTRVLGEWRMRRGGGRGYGVVGLFAGDSGTGKTMAAEVIAADLAFDMYTVRLSAVVSKWIGETEKNLDRIFDEAESINAVLVFDEADALFGKRSEVRDAQDRYANVETAYLLQRLESFDGLAILTTNLRANLDDAFTRRLDAVVEFPRPDEPARRQLWHRCLAPPVPCDPDADIETCARTFALSGGSIRAASVSAGYRAAADDRPIGTRDLVDGVAQEYRKLGLLIGPEFGSFSAVPNTSTFPNT